MNTNKGVHETGEVVKFEEFANVKLLYAYSRKIVWQYQRKVVVEKILWFNNDLNAI